jgi:hypothetical protein
MHLLLPRRLELLSDHGSCFVIATAVTSLIVAWNWCCLLLNLGNQRDSHAFVLFKP